MYHITRYRSRGSHEEVGWLWGSTFKIGGVVRGNAVGEKKPGCAEQRDEIGCQPHGEKCDYPIPEGLVQIVQKRVSSSHIFIIPQACKSAL